MIWPTELPHEDTTPLIAKMYKNGDGVGSDTPVAMSPSDTGNRPSALTGTEYREFYVYVNDGYIQVGDRDSNGNDLEPFLSWYDSAVHDINYILVENFQGADTVEAHWEFCDGGKDSTQRFYHPYQIALFFKFSHISKPILSMFVLI